MNIFQYIGNYFSKYERMKRRVHNNNVKNANVFLDEQGPFVKQYIWPDGKFHDEPYDYENHKKKSKEFFEKFGSNSNPEIQKEPKFVAPDEHIPGEERDESTSEKNPE